MTAPHVASGSGARLALAADLAARYEAGASIRRLAAETGRCYTGVRDLLLAAGVTLRPQGGGYRKKTKGAKL